MCWERFIDSAVLFLRKCWEKLEFVGEQSDKNKARMHVCAYVLAYVCIRDESINSDSIICRTRLPNYPNSGISLELKQWIEIMKRIYLILHMKNDVNIVKNERCNCSSSIIVSASSSCTVCTSPFYFEHHHHHHHHRRHNHLHLNFYLRQWKRELKIYLFFLLNFIISSFLTSFHSAVHIVCSSEYGAIYTAKHLFFSFISHLQRHHRNHCCCCCRCFGEQFSFCFMRTGGKNTFEHWEETRIWRDRVVKWRCAFVQFRYKIIEVNKRSFV